MTKRKICLFLNLFTMIADFTYVFITKLGLTGCSSQQASSGMQIFDFFYIFIMAIITVGGIGSYKLKNIQMFYLHRVFVGIVLIVGEFVILSHSMYFEYFWGISIFAALIGLYYTRKESK